METYENSVAYPLTIDMRGIRRAGVFAEGKLVRDSLLFRRGKPHIRPTVETEAPTEILDEAIYGGFLFQSFGHFLLESLSRLTNVSSMNNIPIIWLNGSKYSTWQIEILSLLGIGNKPIFIQNSTLIKRLHIPKVGYQIDNYFPTEHVDFLSCLKANVPVAGRKCWLSRSQLPANLGGVEGEIDIEANLASLGWEIFHPQDHSVRDQIAFLSSCETIAGWEGSAFHGLVLASGLKSSVHIFARGKTVNGNYTNIADKKGFKQTIHYPPLVPLSGERSKTRWQLQDSSAVVDALHDL